MQVEGTVNKVRDTLKKDGNKERYKKGAANVEGDQKGREKRDPKMKDRGSGRKGEEAE